MFHLQEFLLFSLKIISFLTISALLSLVLCNKMVK